MYSSNQAASSSWEPDVAESVESSANAVGESVESSAGPEVAEIIQIDDDESEQDQSSDSTAPLQFPDLSCKAAPRDFRSSAAVYLES